MAFESGNGSNIIDLGVKTLESFIKNQIWYTKYVVKMIANSLEVVTLLLHDL